MGNSAILMDKSKQIGVYLHWNGGLDSVTAFCEYCNLKRIRDPENDPDYAWGRFCQIVGNFFGGTLSLGVGLYSETSGRGCDNGVYIIGKDWKIIGRKYMTGSEQRSHKLSEMLEAIDEAQPEKEQLGKEFLRAEVVPVSELKKGDKVAFVDCEDGVINGEVLGFGGDKPVNGNVSGIPFIGRFSKDGSNPNDYLRCGTVRRLKQ